MLNTPPGHTSNPALDTQKLAFATAMSDFL